jgi:hypothetical protein
MVTRMPARTHPTPIDLQERRLDRTVLRTYRTRLDLDELIPNPNQPRLGPKEDPELQRQIEANEGDIKSCFDKISHDWLLAHVPTDRVILQKWLKSGYPEKHV